MILDKRAKPGWLIMVKVRIHEKVFVITNVYLPPTCTLDVYHSKLELIDKHLKKFKCDNIILLGDFNVTLTDLDCRNHWSSAHSKMVKFFTPFLDQWELQDSWCLQNPYTVKFIHQCSNVFPRRLDYIFTSLNSSPYVSDTSIGISYCSNHSPMHGSFIQ